MKSKVKKQKKGIVITTSAHTNDWLDGCIRSVQDLGYPILVVINDPTADKPDDAQGNDKFMVALNNWNGFEMGGIQRGAEVFDEFVHLMDTCVVTNGEAIHKMFEHDGSVYFCRGFFSYLGKYKSAIVKKTGVPKVEDKEQAIYHEHAWHKKYLANDKNAVQFIPHLPVATDVFEVKNGRNNMVLDNGFIKKWKGTWR